MECLDELTVNQENTLIAYARIRENDGDLDYVASMNHWSEMLVGNVTKPLAKMLNGRVI